MNDSAKLVLARTVVQYGYEPADYFEAPFLSSSPDYELHLENGLARATLVTPVDPVPASISDAVRAQTQALLSARQLLTHRPYTLGGLSIEQYDADGRRHATVFASGAAIGRTRVGRADVIVYDASGKVVHDTRAERIAEEDAFVSSIAKAASKHPLVIQLLGSYRAAVENPETELVHLYEIRDALQKHFMGENKAKSHLGIAESDWDRLGVLANAEPLEEGRHRGKHLAGRRPATRAEREEARAIARRMIVAFAGRSRAGRRRRSHGPPATILSSVSHVPRCWDSTLRPGPALSELLLFRGPSGLV